MSNLQAPRSEDVVEPTSPDFDAFCQEAFDWARRLAYVLTGDAQAADDLAQEGLARLVGRFDGLENPRAYLRVVIVNLSRRQRRRTDGVESLSDHTDLAMPQLSRQSERLMELIDELPSRQRAVLVLRYYENLSETEIASALSCRPGTVKSLASRALRRLRKEMGQ